MNAQTATDTGITAAVLLALAGWLPPIAAILGIIWYLIQISESVRFKQFVAFLLRLMRRSTPSQD